MIILEKERLLARTIDHASAAQPQVKAETLTALERRVVEIARGDTLATLELPKERSRIAWLISGRERVAPNLANEGLEAIRRLAVRGWHHLGTPPSRIVGEARTAGLRDDQIDAVLGIIRRTIGSETLYRKIAP